MYTARYDLRYYINLPIVGHAQLKVIEIVTLVKRAPNFSFRERNCGVGNVYCWAITQASGRSCCGR